jgi:cell filamentation protein
MNYLRSAHERAAFQRVFYDGTEVYVNRLAIRDVTLLEKTERAFTDRRALQGFPAKAHHRSYAGFKAIHRHLFQDLYDWAGKERTYTTGRGPLPFAVPEHISSWTEQQFSELKRVNFLADTAVHEFADAAARLVNEINAAHPFIDGNGRTQRFWLRMLAGSAGYGLAITETDRQLWNEASRIGFVESNHGPMTTLIAQRLKVQ